MKPIQLDFKPSIVFTLIICAMGLGAGAILILPALIGQIKMLLGIVILSAVIYTVCQYGLLILPWSYTSLNISSNNQVQLVRRDGKRIHVHVRDDSMVTPYLTIVNCNVTDATLLMRLFATHVLILPDALEAESYRQFRVWLRWGKAGDTL